MGWLPWSSDDPLKDIDPSLREYLQKQAPRDYTAATSNPNASSDSSISKPANKFAGSLGLSVNAPDFGLKSNEDREAEPQDRPLPRESLFQDGRYAHLWKTYQPQSEAEEAGKSDQEKLMDILGGYRQRQEQVKTAALENCADEQWAIQECFRSGSWASRMTMCRSENKALERCVTVQSQFLRALGYLSPYQRPEAESERIQMHADTLYHRMLDQERQVNDAKSNGLPPPEFAPLITEVKPGEQADTRPSKDPHQVTPKLGNVTFDTLPEKLQQKISKERLEGKTGFEADLVLKEINQEIATHEALIRQLGSRYMVERTERLQRQEQGQERFTDKVYRLFDFRDWAAVDQAAAAAAAAAARKGETVPPGQQSRLSPQQDASRT